ncbi:hypothetical protein GCM10011579_069260 [Streptomyces albiflavescens]|uniref:Uncharacterized protein n=1 Tax=Streptomyces albiflavescens TaxID=1623582 RepID=A0A918D801_9ACTN|nr:hypothetical protein [Streptomyces albiflavescens]GGN82030.1 hypothetical protein GCM10011579_069260 [Streptomyces albiflavescens]
MSWQSGEPETAPTVYLPQSDGEATPAYEAYTDPAEAHGWQKGYEEGGDGAPVARGADGDGEDTLVQDAVPGDPSGDPSGRRERLLRRRRARLLRRLAVAGGVACVVLLAVVISGVFDSGASEGSRGTGGKPASPPHLPTGAAAPTQGSATTAGTSSVGPSPTASPGVSGSAGAASASPSASASTAPASTAPATATATSTTEDGRGNSNGHGQGATKRPK